MGIFDVNNFDAYKDIRYLVDAPINPPNPTKTIFIITYQLGGRSYEK